MKANIFAQICSLLRVCCSVTPWPVVFLLNCAVRFSTIAVRSLSRFVSQMLLGGVRNDRIMIIINVLNVGSKDHVRGAREMIRLCLEQIIDQHALRE